MKTNEELKQQTTLSMMGAKKIRQLLTPREMEEDFQEMIVVVLMSEELMIE